jgi:hypothetical protein
MNIYMRERDIDHEMGAGVLRQFLYTSHLPPADIQNRPDARNSINETVNTVAMNLNVYALM